MFNGAKYFMGWSDDSFSDEWKLWSSIGWKGRL